MIPETRISGRVSSCDGCLKGAASVELKLKAFPVRLCTECRADLFGAPDTRTPYSDHHQDSGASE